jgi:hypothetical protein
MNYGLSLPFRKFCKIYESLPSKDYEQDYESFLPLKFKNKEYLLKK